MPISLTRLRAELMKSLDELGLDPAEFLLSPQGREIVAPRWKTQRTENQWEEVARAIHEIAQACGIEVKIGLNLTTDTMCAKVAGNTYTVSRKDVEDRNFQELYAALAREGQAAYQQSYQQRMVGYRDNYAYMRLAQLGSYPLTRWPEGVTVQEPVDVPVDPQSSFVVTSPPIDLSQDTKEVAAPAPDAVPELDLD